MQAVLKKEKRSVSRANVIPDKLYFKIGEVAQIVGVKPYVLRYWQTEFPDITPTKSSKGQRLYKRKDVELIMKIRDLLYNQKYTIDGARRRLTEKGKKGADISTAAEIQMNLALPEQIIDKETLIKIRDSLKEVLKELAAQNQ